MKQKPCPFCGYVGTDVQESTSTCRSCGSSSPIWDKRTNILLKRYITERLDELAQSKWDDMDLGLDDTVPMYSAINESRNVVLELIDKLEI